MALHDRDVIFGCQLNLLVSSTTTQCTIKIVYILEKVAYLLPSSMKFHHMLHSNTLVKIWVSVRMAKLKEINLCVNYKPPYAPSSRLDHLSTTILKGLILTLLLLVISTVVIYPGTLTLLSIKSFKSSFNELLTYIHTYIQTYIHEHYLKLEFQSSLKRLISSRNKIYLH